jgi:hypothetical protein
LRSSRWCFQQDGGAAVSRISSVDTNGRGTGTGPLYQGRFKSFPVQQDEHLLTVCRYVERNPLRAGLVSRAEEWRWSSLSYRAQNRLPGWLHA